MLPPSADAFGDYTAQVPEAEGCVVARWFSVTTALCGLWPNARQAQKVEPR